MKLLYNILALGAIICCAMLSSCVSKGKYLTDEAHIKSLQYDSSDTHASLKDCHSQVKMLKDDSASLQGRLSEIQKDLENFSSSANNTIENAKNTIAKSNMTIAEQAKRLRDLQNLIQSQRDVMNKLRKSIADALVNFKPDELSVYIKDGNVYVSLQEKLLFKSGSAVVDPKGRDALGVLAQVLNVTPDITVTIEGHTDSVHIHNAKFEDNWALSAGRALSVVRILTDEYAVDPHRIIASARSKFKPMATNDTPEGRTSNRRTEIILSPNLAALYQLLAAE